ncbi:MAG: DUF1704 domain-containing protein [Candidatus Nanohaloarchaea archaeon]|nr:DUF1704 domain-containing protein [Candidatus Nanohaloarchaea archaeon]
MTASEEIDRLVSEVKEDLQLLSLVSPTNLDEQKEKFLQGEVENPEFEYSDPPEELDTFEQELDRLKPPEDEDEAVQELYAKTIDELKTFIGIAKNIGDEEKVREYSKKIWGKPDEETLELAKDTLRYSDRTQESEEYIRASGMKNRVEEVLEDLDVDWDAFYADTTTMRVFPAEERLEIPAGREFTENELERLPVHEIAGHALRGASGAEQPYGIMQSGAGEYKQIEEGITTFLEDAAGLMDTETIRKYAARVIAVDSMLEGDSFRETYEKLTDPDHGEYRVDEDTAWSVTYRAHRAGGLSKDHIYLDLYRKLTDYLEEEEGDLKDLYIGKVNTDDAERLSELEQIREPLYAPHDVVEEAEEYWERDE